MNVKDRKDIDTLDWQQSFFIHPPKYVSEMTNSDYIVFDKYHYENQYTDIKIGDVRRVTILFKNGDRLSAELRFPLSESYMEIFNLIIKNPEAAKI